MDNTDKIKTAIDGAKAMREICKEQNYCNAGGVDGKCPIYEYCPHWQDERWIEDCDCLPSNYTFPTDESDKRTALLSDLKQQIEKNGIKREELFDVADGLHAKWIDTISYNISSGNSKHEYRCNRCGLHAGYLLKTCPKCLAIMDNAEESK